MQRSFCLLLVASEAPAKSPAPKRKLQPWDYHPAKSLHKDLGLGTHDMI